MLFSVKEVTTVAINCNFYRLSVFIQTKHIRTDLFCRGSASNTACTSATSTASSDMVVEGGSKDGLSDTDDGLVGFDDSPLLFPE